MASRPFLHLDLVRILGSNNVYYQPPESIKMRYPCIVYSLDDRPTDYADNKVYKHANRYQVTYIDTNPDSTIPEKILESFEYCRFARRFTSENLYHDVFDIYY